MQPVDYLLIAVLVLIIGGAVIYIVKAKKRGVKCIGCPAAGKCSRGDKNTSACACGCGSTGAK